MKHRNHKAHIVVDMLYDFIDGTMACHNAFEALNQSIKFINENPEIRVLYVTDSHPEDHCSFIEYGGKWPSHCVKGTRGQKIHDNYSSMVVKAQNRPSTSNTLRKGENKELEQYSGIDGKNQQGKRLETILKEQEIIEVFVSGVATEYCIRETVTDLHKYGFKVNLLNRALAYVDPDGHKKTIEELKKFINII
jgi:nicotinamidase-related amidase